MLGDLTELIEKFDNEKFKGLTDFEHIQIFNALKDLEMYEKVGTIYEFMDLKTGKPTIEKIISTIIEKIISTIEKELSNSNHTEYKCEDDSIIHTDVGYVEEWFNEYKHVLRERYQP